MKKFLWAAIYGTALTAFTVYIALDTFVLSRKLQTNAGEMNSSMFHGTEENNSSMPYGTEENNSSMPHGTEEISGSMPHDTEGNTDSASEAQEPEADYASGHVSITLTEYNWNNTDIYVADVQVDSAEYLKTAFAENTYGRNVKEKTSSIAASNDAVFAVNGDYYGAQERGIVIRNGVAYRENSDGDDIFCLYADGTMKTIRSNSKSADELVEEGVWQAWNFGPSLVEDGGIVISEKDEVDKAMASNPRTAIGMIDSCHYVFVVSDGRTRESEGLSLYELAQFMLPLGVQTAYNLDGGGSSTMYFEGMIVNKPTTNGTIKERRVSDIIYIGRE